MSRSQVHRRHVRIHHDVAIRHRRVLFVLHQGEQLTFEGLATRKQFGAGVALPDEGPLGLDEVVVRHIRRVLGLTGGKIHGPGGAGDLLEMNPNTLRHRMKKLGIPFRKELGPSRRRP